MSNYKVVVYPSAHKDDQVLLSAYSWGGWSLVNNEDFPSYHFATNVSALSGLGQLSVSEMSKLMVGKSASVSPYIEEIIEGIGGSSSKKDIETMFQRKCD